MRIRIFILKLFLILLPAALAVVFIEYKLAEIPNSFNIKRANIEQQANQLDAVAIGSSQFTYGINPSYFSCKLYNLANISQDIYYDSALINKCLYKLPKLKLVLIEVNYMAFGYELRSNPVESWRTAYYYKTWGIKNTDWSFFDPSNYSYISLYSVPVVKEILMKGFDTNFASSLMPNGWMKYDTLHDVNDSSGKKRLEVFGKLMRLSDSARVKKCAENLVKELTSKNIKVVLVFMPSYSTFRKYCNTSVLRANELFIHELCRKYGCYYVNYFSDSRFIISDFHDNDHLDYIGARKLSSIINSEVTEPLMGGVSIKSD